VAYTFGGPSQPTTQGYSHETVFLDIETHLFDAKAEKLIWGPGPNCGSRALLSKRSNPTSTASRGNCSKTSFSSAVNTVRSVLPRTTGQR